jgi:integrase/recombinase XerD
VERADLRLVGGGADATASVLDAQEFQAACVDDFVGSCSARGFSEITIENATGVLERFLTLLAVPAWEATPEDIDRVVAELVAKGMAPSTRRGYVQSFKDFHRYLVARKAAQIEVSFGVQIADPLDEFNAARHVGNDSPSTRPPPTPERMELFFEFLRDRVASARKFAPAGRD